MDWAWIVLRDYRDQLRDLHLPTNVIQNYEKYIRNEEKYFKEDLLYVYVCVAHINVCVRS